MTQSADRAMLSALIMGDEAEEIIESKASHGYTGMKGRIVDFLGSGCSPSVVASAVGVEPSYISQLLSDSEFAEAVTAIRLETLQSKTTRDAKYDSIEDKLLEKLDNILPFMNKPSDILKALGMVNAAKRRGIGDDIDAVGSNNVVVNLILPDVMIPKFITNTNNQVIEVGGRTMVTLGASSLEGLAAKAGVV